MRNYLNMRNLAKYLITIIIMLVVYFLLLICVCVCSNEKSELVHIQESVSLFEQEGVYPFYTENVQEYKGQDNFTDSLMFNICYNLSKENIIASIMDMKYEVIPDEGYNGIDELKYLGTEQEFIETSYARCWNGYVVYLKPLLNFFNYSEIRMIMFVILYITILFFLFRVSKQLGWQALFVYLFSLLTVNINDLHYTILYVNTFVISMFFVILLTFFDSNELQLKCPYYSFILGSVISFTDLLITPLVSVGFVLSYILIYYLYINRISSKQVFALCARTTVAWGMGYSITWATKWILGSIVLNKNVLVDALQSVKVRTDTIPEGFSDKDWFEYAFEHIFYYLTEGEYKKELLMIAIVLIIVSFAVYHKKFEFRYEVGRWCMILILCLLPYVWYIVLLNHSGMHAFFTYRNQILTVIGVLIFYFYNVDFKKMFLFARTDV